MAKTHPHLDFPGEADLIELVSSRAEDVREAYLALHRLVVQVAPKVVFSVDQVDASIGYGAHQYGYNGWGMAAVTPCARWVNFALLKGAQLPAREGLLEGGGRTVRHLKLTSVAHVTSLESELRSLIKAAVELHQPL
jgi:hypothetical protein